MDDHLAIASFNALHAHSPGDGNSDMGRGGGGMHPDAVAADDITTLISRSLQVSQLCLRRMCVCMCCCYLCCFYICRCICFENTRGANQCPPPPPPPPPHRTVGRQASASVLEMQVAQGLDDALSRDEQQRQQQQVCVCGTTISRFNIVSYVINLFGLINDVR